MILLAIWLIIAFVTMKMAGDRNRNEGLGFLAGLIFGLFAVIYYFMAGKKA